MTGLNDREIGVHFIRHAPTEYNRDGRFMGTLDPPIVTQDGLASVRPIAHRAEAVGYTSPMRRARQTFEVAFPDLSYQVDHRLQERALGEWEGQTWSQVREGWPCAFLAGDALNPRFTPPGGEDINAFWTRIRSFLLDLHNGDSRPAVVVTHNGCIRAVKAMLGAIEIDDFFVGSEELSHPFFISWSDLRRANLREVA